MAKTNSDVDSGSDEFEDAIDDVSELTAAADDTVRKSVLSALNEEQKKELV